MSGTIPTQDAIIIRGAKTNNLKCIDLDIPRHKLVVVTGLSGSGKTSLVYDTIFKEAQHLYATSLSTYARQFLGHIAPPPVDSIQGLSPAIAIEQQAKHYSGHTTVGSMTEIYDYLQILYTRIGQTYCPKSGELVKKDNVEGVLRYLMGYSKGTPVRILCPIYADDPKQWREVLAFNQSHGLTRVVQNGNLYWIDPILDGSLALAWDEPIYGLIDRVLLEPDNKEQQVRLSDSIERAFHLGGGRVIVDLPDHGQKIFSDRFEANGQPFIEPNLAFFNYNSTYGACQACKGLGYILAISPDKVIPDPSLSVRHGAIAPWRTAYVRAWQKPLLDGRYHFPIDKPYALLSADEKQILWDGDGIFQGIHAFFKYCAHHSENVRYRTLLARYREQTPCHVCCGSRLRQEVGYVKIYGYSLVDWLSMPIHALLSLFEALPWSASQLLEVGVVVEEIGRKLRYLSQVGLGYLTLLRHVCTLSLGEFQRLRLAKAMASPLCGVIYILDEPTIGLHPRDTAYIIQMLHGLKEQGNTVLVIEHDHQVIRSADYIIEMGPGSGAQGGEVIFQGGLQMLLEHGQTYTARALVDGQHLITPPKRSWVRALQLRNIHIHNLKHIDVDIPLQVFTVVTGVSGAGKSSLINVALHHLLKRHFLSKQGDFEDLPAVYGDMTLTGDLDQIVNAEFIMQTRLIKSSRSNPATYLGIYNGIRELFASTPLAKELGYKLGHFSFNSKEGQCPDCHGEGNQHINMQFMADVVLACPTCHGHRFKEEVLEVRYLGKNMVDVLNMTVDEALLFFSIHPIICSKLKILQDIGLGYMALGHRFNLLSTGEAQRLKLAYYLAQDFSGPMLLVLDEPTKGLHSHEIGLLLKAIHALIQAGHTVVVIEHHMDVIWQADWVIDIGPDCGIGGGEVLFEGLPCDLAKYGKGYSADAIRAYCARDTGRS